MHWTGLSRPSWEREIDLQLSCDARLRYWVGTPNQPRQTNRLYRRMGIGAAQRELSRGNGEWFWPPLMAAYRARIGFADTATPCFPTRPMFGTRTTTVCGNSGKPARLRERMEYIWFEFWTTRDRSSFFFLQRATRLRRELRSSSCLKTQMASAFARGPQRSVDESRGVTGDS